MKRFAVTLVLAVIFLSGVVLAGFAPAADAKEDMVVISGRKPVLSDDGTLISSKALKIWRYIVRARWDIHAGNLSQARRELQEAHALMDILEAMDPADTVKDRILMANERLAYESAERVLRDLFPIFSSLDDIEGLVGADMAREHLNKAKKHLENGNKQGASEELKLANEALFSTEITLPLAETRQHILNAEVFLLMKEPKKADAELGLAENGVSFMSSINFSPMVLARKNLSLAVRDYVAGRLEATGADLEEAKAYLEEDLKTATVETKGDITKLLNDIETVKPKITKVDKEVEKELRDLYARMRRLVARRVTAFRGGPHPDGMAK